MSAAAEDRPLRAVLLICTATLCFSIMSGCVKWLLGELPVAQIIWGRYFFHLLFIVLLFPRRLPSLLASARLDLQILRSCFVLGATTCSFIALRYIPLASVAAIGFVGPILVVGLAAAFLGEQVGTRRWVAVGVGFLGVLIILRPGAGTMHWAALLPLAMAGCYAGYQILTRVVRGLAPPLTSLFYTALVGAVATSAIMPFFWTPATLRAWALLAAIGFLGGAGHLAIIKAYESARVSFAAPFVYSELLWATIVGAVVFADIPDTWTFVGAGLLIATGVYILRAKGR